MCERSLEWREWESGPPQNRKGWRRASAAGEAVQKFHGPVVIHEFLFFLAKFGAMRFPPAARELHRMLHVQHLVVHHVSHHEFRHAFAIQLPVDHDLLQRGIETAQQAAPDATAPTQPRLAERTFKIARVELLE